MPLALQRLGSFGRIFCAAVWIAALIGPATAAEMADLPQQFKAALETFQREYRFPGATAAYVLPGGDVGVAAFGLADIRTRTAMTPKSRMLAASIGKTFVGATFVALANERFLGIDDPISGWLRHQDWFSRLPNHDSITIRHLLTHSSGLPDHVHATAFQAAASGRWRGGEIPFSPEQLVAFVLDKPPLFEPGNGWAYSDTGYILLGMIIEAATSQDFYDVVRTRFTEPLKLTQTTPANRPDLRDLATGYMNEDNAFGLPPETTTRPGMMAWNPGVEWTGGGFVSTSRELAIWGAALFQGRAMKSRYLADLLTGVAIDTRNAEVEYGLGVAIYRGGPHGVVYGHRGWIPGYSSSLRFYADHQVSIAFQINTDIGIVDGSTPVIEALERHLADVVIGALDSPIKVGKRR